MNVLTQLISNDVKVLEKKESDKVRADKWSTKFHIQPPVGWLNDPNGLCQFDKTYHFFFQYAPFDAKGGLKLWGEYTSKDMLHWNYEGAVLFPDSPYDCHGVYSGSAYTEDGLIELFYTGNVKFDGDYDYINAGRGANVIYTSTKDGKDFSDKKCLLTTENYPKDYTNHVRDPKVWKEGDVYYMVLGGRKKGDKGAVLLYESYDKLNWKFKREITTKEPFGYMWECPDMFTLGDAMVLSISPQGLKKGEYENQNVYQSGYMLQETYENELSEPKFTEWDMGFDFYAPQTFLDESGRRILVGWAGLPDVDSEYTIPTVQNGWQHVLTLPRELTYKDGVVYQKPIREINDLRKDKVICKNGENITINTNAFDMIVENIGSNAVKIAIEEEFFVYYAKNDMEKTGAFVVEFKGNLGGGRSVRKAHLDNLNNLRIIADTSIIEIFVNDGQKVFTTRYFPEGDSRKLQMESDGSIGDAVIYQLECITKVKENNVMGQFSYVITDEVGIHARPAGLLVKLAKESASAVTISKGDKTVEATKLMAIMGLGAKKGDEVVIQSDDETTLGKLKEFFEQNL